MRAITIGVSNFKSYIGMLFTSIIGLTIDSICFHQQSNNIPISYESAWLQLYHIPKQRLALLTSRHSLARDCRHLGRRSVFTRGR